MSHTLVIHLLGGRAREVNFYLIPNEKITAELRELLDDAHGKGEEEYGLKWAKIMSICQDNEYTLENGPIEPGYVPVDDRVDIVNDISKVYYIR